MPRRDARTAILDAAIEVFCAEGYGGASMSRIAARAGGSKQTLYAHFPSKLGLFDAALHEAVRRLASPRQSENAVTPLGQNPLEATIRDYLAFVTHPDAIALRRLMLADGWRITDAADLWCGAWTPAWRRVQDMACARGAVENPFAADMTGLRARFEADLLTGLILGSRPPPSPTELDGMADTALAQLSV
jgi:AcrR family transcriptional regulator